MNSNSMNHFQFIDVCVHVLRVVFLFNQDGYDPAPVGPWQVGRVQGTPQQVRQIRHADHAYKGFYWETGNGKVAGGR